MNPVEQYIFNQNNEARELLLVLRDIILKSDQNISEKISYRIPFFYRNKPFCYLNLKPNGIDIGFWAGPYFQESLPFLETKGRKIIKTYFIPFDSEINPTELKSILTEAIEIDKRFAKNK